MARPKLDRVNQTEYLALQKFRRNITKPIAVLCKLIYRLKLFSAVIFILFGDTRL